MNYVEKIYNFYNSLKTNELIVNVDPKNNVPKRLISQDRMNEDRRYIAETRGIKIPENENQSLASTIFSVCWRAFKNGDFIYGGFEMNGYHEIFLNNSDFWCVYNSLNSHKPPAEELEFLKKLNWFEKQSWSDDGKFGCFLRQPGDFPLPIYFYDSGAYFSMPLSLEAYFDAMIDSCAVRGWQYFYIDIPEQFPEFREVNKHKVLAEMELTLNLLPNLFQNKDFSYHMNRFEGFKNIIIQKP